MTTPPPIIPGNPPQDPQPYYPPTQQNPQAYYPQAGYPQSAPPAYYYPQPVQQPPQDPNAGIRKAGTFAVWLWIVLTLIPLVIIGGCVALCLLGGIFGAATDNPTTR